MVLPFLKKWFAPPVRRTSVASRWFRPRLEGLEERLAPVNDIQTSFSAVTGTLTIRTVDQVGEAEILANDNDQFFQILGAGPGNVTLHKSSATTINGGVADVPFTGVVHIVLDLKEGDDFVVFKGGFEIAGDLIYKGGEGGNGLNLDGDGGTNKLRNLTFTNGNGVDNFAFLDGNTIISGSVTINTGTGGSNFNIGFNLTDDVTIAGNLNITCDAGSDNINFFGDDLSIGGTVTIKGGSGDNSVRFNYDNSLVIAKALSIINGSGNDVVEFGNAINKSSSLASVTVINGAGNNTVRFKSTTSDTINGNLTITNGAGDCDFTVDSVDFIVTGKLLITNGAGTNKTDISPTTTNSVGGLFKLINLAGKDTITISGTTVTYKAVAISNGNGDTTTQITGGILTFDSISITNGDGLDTLNVTATTKFDVTLGGFTLKNGAGGSVTILAATGAAIFAVKGSLSILNGTGTDSQTIGNGAGTFNGLHGVIINNGAGVSNTTFNPTSLTITGSVSITNGDGNDSVLFGTGVMSSLAITGSVTVINGDGGSNTVINPTSSASIGLGFTVKGTDGNDTVDFLRATVSGTVSLSLGNGNNTVEIDNAILAALSILTGVGNDQVKIENNSNDGNSTTILGVASINLGGNNDTLDFGLDANDKVTASKPIVFNGGLGLDTFDQNAATNTFTGSILGFEVQLP